MRELIAAAGLGAALLATAVAAGVPLLKDAPSGAARPCSGSRRRRAREPEVVFDWSTPALHRAICPTRRRARSAMLPARST